MARLHASYSVDMTDFSTAVGRFISSNAHTLVVRSGQTETRYHGDFSYPHGGWEGTIEGVSVFHGGVEQWSVTGIGLDTRFAMAGADREATQRRAFSGDDLLFGSGEGDKLIGYARNDRVSGGGGDDLLLGCAGNDTLAGGRGRDTLRGQDGADVLQGDQGNDRCAGGAGADRFLFDGSDGVDRIEDFGWGDRIEILGGARRFYQLDIERAGSDVRVSFADTVILVEDVALRSIGAEDFVF